MLQTIARKVARMPRRQVLQLGFVLVTLVSIITFFKGTEAIVGVLFLMPVVLVTWGAGRSAGIVTAVVCVLASAVAEDLAGKMYSHPLIATWNGLVDLGTYLVVVFSLDGLRAALRREQVHARRDTLTGIANRHSFQDTLEFEFDRARRYRHPLTVAYLDLDNFKAVNDTRGHEEGDRVLCEVARILGATARKVDKVARLGGDEFGVLMPETGQEEARRVLGRIVSRIVERMRLRGWPVTVSGGCAIFVRVPEDVNDLVRYSDALMYQAKRAGKNRLSCVVFGDADTAEFCIEPDAATAPAVPVWPSDDGMQPGWTGWTPLSPGASSSPGHVPAPSWRHMTRRTRHG